MTTQVVTLGELITPARSVRAGTDRYPILSMTMHHGLIDQEDKFKKRIASRDTSTYKVVSRGQLVVGFPIDEGVLAIQYKHPQAIVSPAYGIWDIVDSSRIYGPYLERYLRSPKARAYYAGRLRGTTARRRSLPDDVFLKLPVPLPSHERQQEVAEALDQVDTLRLRRREASTLIDDLARSIFFEIFGPLQSTPMTDLGDYLTFITSGGRGWAKYYSETGSRFLRSLDVQMNEIDDHSAVYVIPPQSAEARRTQVRAGDVLLTITGSLIGRATPVLPDHAGSYVSQHVAILRIKTEVLAPEFLAFFLSLPTGGQLQISRMQYGQTKPGLNFEQIRKLQVPTPDLELQIEFIRRLNLVRNIRIAHTTQAAGLDALFSSLQQRAFRGDLWENQDN